MAEPSGGLEFLQHHGARRAGGYGDAPDFFGLPLTDEDLESDDAETSEPIRDFNYEDRPWQPIPVHDAPPFAHPCLRPERFVDGKDSGRTVAYVLAPQGWPVPIRVAQIGGIALRSVPGTTAAGPDELPRCLRVEGRQAEQVVSFMADLFPWDEVERFAAALQANGFRLLIAPHVADNENTDMRNIAQLDSKVRYRTREEMFRLEREQIRQTDATAPSASPPLTVCDGRLNDRMKGEVLDPTAPVIGVIKSHMDTSYLHDAGWNTVYEMGAGERTPVVAYTAKNRRPFVTWYVRLGRGQGGGPLDGVIRAEMSRPFFEKTAGKDFDFVSAVSGCLCRWRTHHGSYSRAAATLEPIRLAEEKLAAGFLDRNRLISRFYRLVGL